MIGSKRQGNDIVGGKKSRNTIFVVVNQQALP